jgi:hypothetical protein
VFLAILGFVGPARQLDPTAEPVVAFGAVCVPKHARRYWVEQKLIATLEMENEAIVSIARIDIDDALTLRHAHIVRLDETSILASIDGATETSRSWRLASVEKLDKRRRSPGASRDDVERTAERS